MKPSRIRFLYLGRAGATRKLLVDLLRCAGYTVTTETRADADVTRNASDLVITTQGEIQRNDRRGAPAAPSSSPRRRPARMAAAPAAGRRTGRP